MCFTLCVWSCGEASNFEGPDSPSGSKSDVTEEVIENPKTVSIDKAEVEQRGLYYVPFDDHERLYSPILKNRRTTVDMRPGTAQTLVITLEGPANLRWHESYYNQFQCSIAGGKAFYNSSYWIYNPFVIDYGPVIARSLSPTEIEIIRKENVSADQKPVEIALERSAIGMAPYELGVRATLVVELSDTPADSRDTDDSHYISMDQADAMGLFHMPFDCEEFHTPILENGSLLVEIPAGQTSITVELNSPAMPGAVLTYGYGVAPIEGIRYLDRDVKEWIFTPSYGCTESLEYIMTDPLHVTINLRENFELKNGCGMFVPLERGDYWNASDAGATQASIDVVVK